MANPFDQFGDQTNPFDQFGATVTEPPKPQENFLDKVKRIARTPSPEWIQPFEKRAAAFGRGLGNLVPRSVEQAESMVPPWVSPDPSAWYKLASSLPRQAQELQRRGAQAYQAPLSPDAFESYGMLAGTLLPLVGLRGARSSISMPRAGATIEMPGAVGFTLGRGEAPPPYIEPSQPSWQPVQPDAPMPYGPRPAAWEGPMTSPTGETFDPTQMWPLSRGISSDLADQIRQLQRERLANAVNQPKPAQFHGPVQQPEIPPESAAQMPADVGSERVPASRQTEVPELPPEVQAPPIESPRKFTQRPPFDTFGSETTPVSAAIINDIGGIKSKSAARSQGRLEGNTDLYDGAPALSHPTHNKIYNPTGEMPDVAANDLYEAGLITDSYPDTMWQALEAESRFTRKAAEAERTIQAQGKEIVSQGKAFEQTQKFQAKAGAPSVAVRDLQVGDTVKVSGEDFKVTDIDPDNFDVTLQDGSKFGVQHVTDDAVVYGEHEPATALLMDEPKPKFSYGAAAEVRGQGREIPASPATAPGASNLPRIQETPEGELFTAEEIPFNLRGEELTQEATPEGIARAKAQAEAEAKKAQGTLFGRAGIKRAGEAGGVPRPAPSRVLAPGAVRGSGRYRQVYQVNKEAGDKINALAASRESAELRATIQSRKVLGDLTPEEATDLGRYLVSERLKTVNPDHPQILSPMETAKISRQPGIARALNRYKADVKPEIEALRKKAGLTSEAAARKGREFISLVPTTDEMLPELQTPVGTVPLRFRSKTTRFARRAEGMAAKYETDLTTVLRESYREVTQKARLRDFYDSLVKNGLATTDAVDEIKGQPAQPIAIGRSAAGELSTALPDVAFMPKQIGDALRDVMERQPDITSPLLKVGKAAQRAITGTALTANPAELVNHMRRQLDIVAAQPAANVPWPVRALEAVTPYFGPRIGVAVRTLTEDMSAPVNQSILQDIFDAGGGSARAFQEYQAKGWLARKTGLSKLQEATRNLLFGIPEGRGIGGWDLRMRVQLEKIRRAVEGNTDPQRIREFSNQIGQYTSKPDKLIETTRVVNPYAATTLPMRWTELKQLTGTSGLKAATVGGSLGLRAETLLRGVGGTLVALTTANYLLSGKWPWENDKGHELDLNTGQRSADGKEVYVKLRALAPTLSRPVNTLSLPELMRERGAGKGKSYTAAAAIGPTNQALSLVSSPLSNTLLTAGTGYAPYFTRVPGRPPSLYDVAATKQKNLQGAMADRGLRQIMAALQGINPIGRGFEQRDLPGPLGYIERSAPGVEPFGRIFTSSYQQKSSTRKHPETLRQKLARERRKQKP